MACETLLGCDIENGGCGETGCTKCLPGYYLDDFGDCKLCSSKLTGCVECNSSTECTKCVSHLLEPTDGKCACKANMPNASTNYKGSCVCNSGFYMTEKGCLTC